MLPCLRTLLIIPLILLLSCSNPLKESPLFGDVSFKVEVTQPNLFTTDLSITNTDLFAIRIENAEDRSEVITFSHLHDIPSRLKLRQGRYNVYAYSSPSHSSDELIFKGKKRLTVIEGNETLLNIQCSQEINQ